MGWTKGIDDVTRVLSGKTKSTLISLAEITFEARKLSFCRIFDSDDFPFLGNIGF